MINSFISKEVEFKFQKKTLKFALSHALFSSFQIDLGSQFLLKSIAKQGLSLDNSAIFDLGCGVGTIGLSILAGYENVSLSVQDRNNFAIEWTKFNAEKNGLIINKLHYGLAFQNVEDNFDYIVSNIPAKAGAPVIEEMIRLSILHLNKDGLCCMVVVRPLTALFSSILVKYNCKIDYVEKNSDYSVFHFGISNKTVVDNKEFSIDPYIRTNFTLPVLDNNWEIQTVYNLPEFDSISFDTQLATKLYFKSEFSSAVFLDPNQGILPIIFLSLNPNCKIVNLISSDNLQLEIATINIKKCFPDVAVNCFMFKEIVNPSLVIQKLKNNFCVLPFETIPEVDYFSIIKNLAFDISSTDSYVLFFGKSANLIDAKLRHSSFYKIKSKKHKGFKAVLLGYKPS